MSCGSIQFLKQGGLRNQIALNLFVLQQIVKILTIIFFNIYLHLSGIYDIITLYFFIEL